MSPRQLCDCGECKRCKNRERCRRWRLSHPDYVVPGAAAYREANRERIKERQRAYYLENRERIIQRVSDWRNRDIEAYRASVREAQKHASPEERRRQIERAHRWREKNRDKVRAYSLVAHAIRRGALVKKPCEVCGKTRVDAHHDDYSKPLDVRWLCRVHHKAVHAAN